MSETVRATQPWPPTSTRASNKDVDSELMPRLRLQKHVSGFINLLAEFLSTWQGFVLTIAVLLLGVAVGALVQFNEGFMFGFNIFLSVAAIVIAGIILVAGARSEAALHVKLDYLIEHSKASNKVVGLEHKDASEIERERERVEKEAAEMIDEAVDEALDERLGGER